MVRMGYLYGHRGCAPYTTTLMRGVNHLFPFKGSHLMFCHCFPIPLGNDLKEKKSLTPGANSFL